MKRKVAIFDIDGTVFRSSLIIELVEELVKRDLFPSDAKEGYEKELYNWLDRRGHYEEYIKRVVEMFMKHIKGVAYADFLGVCESVVESHKDRTYRFTKDLIRTLAEKNYYLLAISQSPKTILDPFCKYLGFHKVYGRIYELGPQDKFTGNLVDKHLIENKSYIVKRAIEKENLTLNDSYGIGDTENDISFLEMVAHPICFNPDKKLYLFAKRAGWKVVVERKDVIYEL